MQPTRTICDGHIRTPRKSASRAVRVWWSCGGVVVLQSSVEVYLCVPAPTSNFSDISAIEPN